MKQLSARQKSVQAAESVRRVSANLEAHPAAEAFAEMAERVAQMEDRHQALLELDGEDELASQLEALADPAVEAELEELKRELEASS